MGSTVLIKGWHSASRNPQNSRQPEPAKCCRSQSWVGYTIPTRGRRRVCQTLQVDDKGSQYRAEIKYSSIYIRAFAKSSREKEATRVGLSGEKINFKLD